MDLIGMIIDLVFSALATRVGFQISQVRLVTVYQFKSWERLLNFKTSDQSIATIHCHRND